MPSVPFEQRHRQDALRLLAVFLLQVSAHQQVELLVGTAEFQVGLQRHRVVALHQRVQQLVDGDRAAGAETLCKVVTLEHARQRVLRGQVDHAARAERVAPLAVVADLGLRRVEHEAGLAVVGLGVGFDLLARERRARRVAAGGVADHRREVADEKDHGMPKVLQLAHLVQHHRVADMDVRRRGVEAELDAQRLAGGLGAGQLLQPFIFGQQVFAAAAADAHRLADAVGDRVGRGRLGHGGYGGVFSEVFRGALPRGRSIYSAARKKTPWLGGRILVDAPHRPCGLRASKSITGVFARVASGAAGLSLSECRV